MAVIIMDNVVSNVNGNFPFPTLESATFGSLQISTSGGFNGSTTTASLQGSNDESAWSTVFADDNTTPLSFTLSPGSNTYDWLFKKFFYRNYRIVYVAGNASVGTVKAVLNVRS